MSQTKGAEHLSGKSLSRTHRQLVAELKRLREGADLSGHRLADALSWSQSKVSKIENGRTRPAVEDVQQWANATGANAETLADLISLTEEVAAEPRAWSGLADRNKEIRQVEVETTHLKNFQPAVVSGLLQTADYARRVMALIGVSTPEEVSAAVAVRLDRQAVLYDQSKKFEFILTEAALRWRPGSPAMMLAQMDRLISLSTLPNVTIGVLPLNQEASLLHTNGFTIFEGIRKPFVLVEALSDERRLDDEQSLTLYRDAFTKAREHALTDAEAVTFVRRLMSELSDH